MSKAAAALTLSNGTAAQDLMLETTGQVTILGVIAACSGVGLSIKTPSNKGVTFEETDGNASFTGSITSEGGVYASGTGVDAALRIDGGGELTVANATGITSFTNGVTFASLSGTTSTDVDLGAGTVIFDTDTNKLSVSDGAAWQALH